ncbi:peptidase M23-like protein [Paralcaligenes ureilyticus]|uniref:Peptidase M23-like protein n=2 Tax=Paralcaligenes ureilyticus TaxID=627131 RepID=A0A4R3LQ01_9BURK|nr:peptidase M23-like protein [Paralcaligenes ureilyticus]
MTAVRILCLLCTLLCAMLAPVAGQAEGLISQSLNHPVPGGVAVLALGRDAVAPRAVYLKNKVLVVRDSDGQWVAVVGIALKTAAGRQVLQLRTGQGARELGFNVAAKKYREQHIALKNKNMVNPDPEQLKRFEREYLAQTHAYGSYRDSAPSNVLLDLPVHGRLSSPFGLRRFFNGEERSPHSGLDFAVPRGTPVKAPADGVITIVDDYFFNGNTVFVDHGQGFITMYCHLSAFNVKLGQHVRRGDVIGYVGSTGRATGPHLHWTISLNNTRVDPAIFAQAFKP